MSRKPTPPPDGRFTTGVFWWTVFATVVLAPVAMTNRWWAVIILLSMWLPIYWAWFLHGFILIVLANWRWRRQGVRGLLILKDSPVHRSYIDRNWVKRFGDQVLILNYSQHRKWAAGRREECVFSRFIWSHGEHGRNHCPAVLLLRGLRFPYVYPAHYAFPDHKHGRSEPLRILERHMYEQLGIPFTEGDLAPPLDATVDTDN